MRTAPLTLSLMVLGVVCSHAQTVNGPGDDVLCSSYTPVVLQSAASLRATQILKQPQPFPSPTAITGKPYSARRVSQELKVSVDGTRLCSAPSIAVDYRDSAGTMRLESNFFFAGPDGKPAPATVRILDPAAEIEYDLDMVNQLAWRFHPLKPVIPPDGASLASAPNPAITSKKESLGTHSFQGVTVDGTRTTTTLNGFTLTNETWVWPYVNGAVLNKSVSPVGGRADVWLNISAAEPDPSLFRVPDGWKIVDGQPTQPTASGWSGRRTANGFQYTSTIVPRQYSDYVVHEVPYSAEQTFESSSNLQVPRSPVYKEPVVKLYRDSSGRTRIDRRQTALEGDTEPAPVFPRIDDPVDDVEIILDPVHHVAHRFPLPRPDTNPPSPLVPPVNRPQSTESTSDLGEQVMEGLKVSGTLQTFRTPAGANNNDRELVETTESWYSPQLRVIVLGKTNTVTQNSVIRLTHISTEEPDISLFEIPAGYTVVDEKGPVTIIVTQP